MLYAPNASPSERIVNDQNNDRTKNNEGNHDHTTNRHDTQINNISIDTHVSHSTSSIRPPSNDTGKTVRRSSSLMLIAEASMMQSHSSNLC